MSALLPVGMARCAIRAAFSSGAILWVGRGRRVNVPSPDAALGDGEIAARFPCHSEAKRLYFPAGKKFSLP